MIKSFITTLLFAIAISAVFAQKGNNLPLIPYPQKVEINTDSLRITKIDQLTIAGSFPAVQKNFKGEWNINTSPVKETSIKGKTGTANRLRIPSEKPSILFIKENIANFSNEGYIIHIDKRIIKVFANTDTGAFYATQTLSQLFHYYKKGRSVSIPRMKIVDQPSYHWRGLMLDVARHFFTLEYLKKTIDRMAYYKANKLHLHLTDDQGWRIEIKQYPLLTEIGAWRELDKNDSACMLKAKENPDFRIDPRMLKTVNGKTQYGGYYTQAQIKELIAYAQQKQVEIIPEIDMPGHFNAAIRAYPFLTGTDKNGWGKNFSIPISPCREDVYAFTQNVLKEIFALFPSSYIHIGADEVEKTTWSHSDDCQQLMKDSSIASVSELQSFFIRRMQRFVEANGKKLITWDDALEGGINAHVTVMYWRNWVRNAPKEALQNGNPLVMSPNEPFYFDYQPDKNSIFNVYHREITTKGIANQPLLLGGQANLWTEMVPSESRADYLVYPRYLALAESMWTNDTALYHSFLTRLNYQYAQLDRLGIHYRLPDLGGFAQESVFVDSALLEIPMQKESNLQVHYTLDGTLPTSNSSMLHQLWIKKDSTVKVAAFNKNGYRGDIYKIHFRKTNYQTPIKFIQAPADGLSVNYYKGYFNGTAHIKDTADSSFVTTAITVPQSINVPSFALDYSGFIDIPETGIYSFFLTCDDGGILKIGNEMIVDNDGLHTAMEKSGQAALHKGVHPFLLRFVEGGGGFTLKLQYSLNGSPLQEIPNSWWKH